MPCVYILHSNKINRFYVGVSKEDSPDKRLAEHNSGKTRSTKFGRPWKIIYSEIVLNYSLARKRELFLKSGVGRKWIHEEFSGFKVIK